MPRAALRPCAASWRRTSKTSSGLRCRASPASSTSPRSSPSAIQRPPDLGYVFASLALQDGGGEQVAADIATPAEASGFFAQQLGGTRCITGLLDVRDESILPGHHVRPSAFLCVTLVEERSAARQTP